MGTRYVEVSREAMCKALEVAGFCRIGPVQGRDRGMHEIVYIRRHHYDRNFVVKVYTTIPAQAGVARDCGEDSIKVVLVEERKVRKPGTQQMWDVVEGRGKATKVLRTGSEQAVIERTLERCREMYSLANRLIRERMQRR